MEEFQDDEKCGGCSKTMRKVELFKTARSVEVFQDDEKSEDVSRRREEC